MRKGAITYRKKICPGCGKEFSICFKDQNRKYCTRGCSKSKSNNPQWKGDKVGYKSLHEWVSGQLGRPDRCSKCGKVGAVDLANISNKYKRDLSDWEWLCRKCHMQQDGRLDIFLSTSNKNNKLPDRFCKHCHKQFHPKNKTGSFCSLSCSTTFNNLAGKLGAQVRKRKTSL